MTVKNCKLTAHFPLGYSGWKILDFLSRRSVYDFEISPSANVIYTLTEIAEMFG